ncbi:MAG: peptide chain release factor N(5)-glutamine methyltransferase [Bacteroidales bacterium]|nr:peptide chain release factor N(5)-glutamine methyltransferase [Bacteroidales bacterium]
MNLRSNKIIDIKKYITDKLMPYYDVNEINSFIFLIFEHLFSFSRVDLVLKSNENINESELVKIFSIVKELKKHKPIQYILGKTNFMGYDFSVTPDVLIPRPETEELVNLIINDNNENDKLNIIDIGTGSGCIAVSLKKILFNSEVFAVDVSEKALEIAKKDALKNNADISFSKLNVLNKDYNADFPMFDIIVSNPPYVRKSEKQMMNKNVLNYEPSEALFVDDDNALVFYKAIFDFASKYLKKNGKIWLEANEYLTNDLKELFNNKGLKNIKVIKDVNNKNRFFKIDF